MMNESYIHICLYFNIGGTQTQNSLAPPKQGRQKIELKPQYALTRQGSDAEI